MTDPSDSSKGKVITFPKIVSESVVTEARKALYLDLTVAIGAVLERNNVSMTTAELSIADVGDVLGRVVETAVYSLALHSGVPKDQPEKIETIIHDAFEAVENGYVQLAAIHVTDLSST